MKSFSLRAVRIRQQILVGVLLIVTSATFVSAWPIRDHELVVRLASLSDEHPVEMYDESPFCTVLPDCFRISHKLIVGLADAVISPIANSLSKFVESTVTDSPTWATNIAQNIGPYAVLRILFLGGMISLLYQYLRKWWLVGVFGNLFLIWLSGAPVRALTALYLWILDNLGIGEFYHDLLTWHISRNSTIFLLEYDLLALLASLAIPLILAKRILHKHIAIHLVAGLVLAITFENLAVVYIVSLVVGEWILYRRIPFRDAIAVAVGWAIPIVSIVVYVRISNSTVFPIVCPDDGGACLSIPELGRSMNSAFRPLIYRLVVGFLIVPFLIGFAIGTLLKLCNVTLTWGRELRVYMTGAIIGLLLTYFVGYFGSALPTEFGRQTLSAQILLILSGAAIAQTMKSRGVLGQFDSQVH